MWTGVRCRPRLSPRQQIGGFRTRKPGDRRRWLPGTGGPGTAASYHLATVLPWRRSGAARWSCSEGQHSIGICTTCHVRDTQLALFSAITLDHHHLLSGVTCQACHGSTEAPAPMSASQCLVCRGPLEDLTARTTGVPPTNPHASPHGPVFAECDLCHQMHKESEDFCGQCHDFSYTVP